MPVRTVSQHSTLVREDFQRIMAQTNKDCRFRNFTLTNSLLQKHSLVGREDSRLRFVLVHNSLRKLCCGSKKWRWVNQWMISYLHVLVQEFEHQILKYSMRRLLQHWTESSITPASRKRSVWRNKKAQKQDRFLRGRQIAYLIYDHFRVTGANDSVENYADLFRIVLRKDEIQEIDSKWDGILLSMTKIPFGDILEGLYKLRIRESEKLKTVLELYNLEIH